MPTGLIHRVPPHHPHRVIIRFTEFVKHVAMAKKTISNGTVHTVPEDLKKALTASLKVLTLWESLTPLARNEWVCWVTFPKREETRKEHVKRVVSELKEGVRRPCCWIGCPHRKDKAISPSVQWAFSKRYSKSR